MTERCLIGGRTFIGQRQVTRELAGGKACPDWNRYFLDEAVAACCDKLGGTAEDTAFFRPKDNP